MPHKFQYDANENTFEAIKGYLIREGYELQETNDMPFYGEELGPEYPPEGIKIVGTEIVFQEPHDHPQLDVPIGDFWCRDAKNSRHDYKSSKKLFDDLKRKFQAKDLEYK